MRPDENCGGDCARCMALAGDPDVINAAFDTIDKGANIQPRAKYLVIPVKFDGRGEPYLTNNDDAAGARDDIFRFEVLLDNGKPIIEIEHYKIRGDMYRAVEVRPENKT